MQKYIFKIENSQKSLSSNDSSLKIMKLKSLDRNSNREIEFCHPNFGTCSIYTMGGVDKVLCWISDERDNTHNSCSSLQMNKHIFNLNDTTAEVVLNDNCEYRISLSYNDNGNNKSIILPRSLILNKNLNLKNYYNKQISLTKGKVLYQSQDEPYYIPEITHKGRQICELDSTFVAYKGQGPLYKIPKRSDDYRYNLDPNIAIEKKDNELLAYFADSKGQPIDIRKDNINIDDIYNHNFNVHLRSALLEHSNIREVLPEFRDVLPEVNIDNSMCSDIRQLGCLVDNNIKKIASELATDSAKRSSISEAITTDANFQRAVADNTDLKTAVADKLKDDKVFQTLVTGPKGEDGTSPDPSLVAAQLLTDDKKDTLVTAVASNTNLRTEVVDKLKDDKVFQTLVTGPQGLRGPKGEDGTSPTPDAVAAQLMNDQNRPTLVTGVAGNQGLQDAVATNLKGDQDFKDSVKGEDANPLEIVNRLKHDGRFKREVRSKVSEKDVKQIADELITEKKEEFGQMVLNASDSSGRNLATQVATKVNLKPEDFIGKVNRIDLAELLFNSIDQSEAIRIAEKNISSYKISELIFDAAKDKLEQAGQWDSSKFVDDIIEAASTYKLAEMLFKASNIGEGEAKTITKERVSSEKLAKHLFDASGLQFDVEQSKTVVSNIVDNFLAVKATELGRIANRLKHDGRFKREIRGEKGEQGEKGDLGLAGNGPAPDEVAAQLLTGEKKDTLVTEVADNKKLQKAVADNGDLRTAVTNTLKSDKDFKDSVKGEDANPLEIVNRLKHDGRFKREIRGEDGQPGPVGPKGEDANPIDVAQELATDSSKRYNISNEIAKDIKFQNAVKYLLNIDGGFKSGVGNLLKSDEDFKKSIKGAKGEDANPLEIVNRLKHDGRFKREIRGEDGQPGPKGEQGREGKPGKDGPQGLQGIRGETGPKGEDANPAEVARKLAYNSSFQSSVAGNSGLRDIVTDSLKNDENFQNYIVQELIAKKANALGQAILNVKHDDREILVNNPILQQGVAAQLMNDYNRVKLVTEIAGNGNLQNTMIRNPYLRTAIANALKIDGGFQESVRGPAGRDGQSPAPSVVAAQLLTGEEKSILITEVADDKNLQKAVANNEDLRASVTNTLKSDTDFKGSVKGEDANPLEIVNRLKHDSRFKREIRGEDADSLEVAKKLANDSGFQASIADNGNLRGAVATDLKRDQDFKGSVKGEDANPLEIVNRLKHDGRFKREIRGEDGQPGAVGLKGKDANPAEVARKLTHDSGFQSSVASNPDLRTSVATNLKSDENFKEDIATQLLTDTNKNTLVTEVADSENLQKAVAGNTNLQKGVAAKLRINPGKAKGPKGEPGNDGQPGLQGIRGETGPKGEDANPSEVARKLAHDSSFQSSVASNPDLRTSVATNLKGDEIFQSAVKGDSDPQGPQGPQGNPGTSPSASDVVTQLLSDDNKDDLAQAILNTKNGDTEILVNNPVLQEGIAAQLMNDQNRPTLVTEVAGNQDLQNAVASNPGLRDAVTDTLKNEGNLGGGDISKIVDSLKPKCTLQKGKELSQGIYEAKVILDDKVIATLPKIGYYMLDDQLVMYNYATQEKVVIPEEFHYLKVVRLGSGFGNDDYKLTFCNTMGNEFFEYKKYDPEYSRVPDEYKFISLSHAKKEYNPNLSELISHRPLFFIAKGSAAPGPDKYAATVFELTRNGKGKKMATLINEFGYFNQNCEFIHCNYHKEPQCRSYTSAEIDEKYQVTDADSEFYLTKYNDIAIHIIPEL